MPPHTQALAALPRSLRISPSTPITRTHLVALYKEQLRTANSFASYNFKQYFLRRTRDKFRLELPSLLDQSLSSSSSSSSGSEVSSSSSSSTPTTEANGTSAGNGNEERLRAWYEESLGELAVMARSAIVNGMYEAPKLVVEGRGKVMAVGGGGAGAEASYGGGGQPANPQ
ncbi:Isd11p [Sporobolomyces salmoneus]|uniref:Isd11p n=1 Tax=Sporobolomyces salmoneus TaxID=183962 RepID=UPI0031789AA6